MRRFVAVAISVLMLGGCAAKPKATPAALASQPEIASADAPLGSAVPSARPTPSASASAKPSRKPAPKPSTTLKKSVPAGADAPKTTAPPPSNDGVPAKGAGTFTGADGGTDVVGTGATLVKYRVEVEDGIPWGAVTAWTPASFASTVDRVLADPRGWTHSADAPVTDPAENMTDMSWSFQRVGGTADFSVRIRLATPDTVDRLCGAVGVHTQGVYSCRFGQTLMINLRRWLNGAPGFPLDMTGYRINVISHEMGHFLGFDHMLCPAAGGPAPVMQTQTISLSGCTANAYPFAADGTFVMGPWAAS